MLVYVPIWFGLYILAGALAVKGWDPAAMVLFVFPVALYWSFRQYGRALGLVACAGLAVWSVSRSPSEVAVYVTVADLGVLIGVGMVRRWRFGVCVATVTLAIFALASANVVLHWEEAHKVASIWINARIADFEQVPAGASAANQQAVIDTFRWFDTHWAYMNLGMLFGFVLLAATVLVALVGRRLERMGVEAGPTGRFRTMRAPEWLVWFAIALALLWFADQRWPNDMLRMVAWNGAIGMAFLYGLNGFSILLYALAAFKVGPFVYYAVLFGVLFLNAYPAVCAVGFFDTWWDFRQRIEQAIEARRRNADSGDDQGTS